MFYMKNIDYGNTQVVGHQNFISEIRKKYLVQNLDEVPLGSIRENK